MALHQINPLVDDVYAGTALSKRAEQYKFPAAERPARDIFELIQD